MPFRLTDEIQVEWRDEPRGIEVINTGGHMQVWHRRMSADGWTIDFSFEERWPDDGAIRVTRLTPGADFPDDLDAAELVREFLEAWACRPSKLKGRDCPKKVFV